MIRPFDQSGVHWDASGCAYYTDRPPSLVHMLRATVDRSPDAQAIKIVGGRSLTYRELWDAAARTAGGLAAAGVARGDRVALRLPNGAEWCVAFFAILLAGATAVPINPALTPPEVEHIGTDSGAQFSVEPGVVLPTARPLAVEDLGPDEVAGILYTSGTTGLPKGATMTHRNFLSNTENVRRIVDLDHDEQGLRNLVAGPLFSVAANNSQLLAMCELGATTVVLPAFAPEAFAHAIEDERVNLLLGSPGIYRLATGHPDFASIDTSSVRTAIYGAAPAAPEFAHEMARHFPSAALATSYGLTEASSVVTYLPAPYLRQHPDSVGFAAPIVDLELFEPDPRTGVGELLVRGGNVVSDYWNAPDATAATFADGWLHTGDLARIDEHGLVYIEDRKKDLIIRGGENVYSVEVENALGRHPSVLEVAVVGVPDDVLGERVGAVLVPRPGADLDPDVVVAAAREWLAVYKLPQWVSVQGEPLPRNPNGKIRKPLLRATTAWRRVGAS